LLIHFLHYRRLVQSFSERRDKKVA
jgi:hypothetical protein